MLYCSYKKRVDITTERALTMEGDSLIRTIPWRKQLMTFCVRLSMCVVNNKHNTPF